MDDHLEEEEDFLPDMPDLQIITLVFDNSTGEVPSLDLGNVSPFIAITLLQAAINTLEMLIPPVDVSYKGRVVCSSAFEIIDDDLDD